MLFRNPTMATESSDLKTHQQIFDTFAVSFPQGSHQLQELRVGVQQRRTNFSQDYLE